MNNIAIARKLPIAFAVLTLLSTMITGLIAYVNASGSLFYAFESKYQGYAASREKALETYLANIKEDLRIQAENPRLHAAVGAFDRAWSALGADAGRKLQAAYIADNPNPTGEKHKLDRANGPDLYHQVHGEYHPWIRKFLEERGYYNVFLFNPNGDLVYTVFKELDYATNVNTGKWKDTDLGNAFRAARDNPKRGFEAFFDFRPYAPSANAPAAFISTPIVSNAGALLGVLVFQMPIDRINKIMQIAEGMGETGETYIVGPDYLMRSDSRFSKESTILKTKVETATVKAGLAGKKGVDVVTDYRGVKVMSAHVPIKFLGTNWVVMAEIDDAEIEAPIHTLTIIMMIAVAVISAVVIAIGIFIARTITKPIDAIGEACNQVADGNTSTEIPGTERGDEIGSMAQALTRIRDDAAKAAELRVMVDTMPINIMTCDPETFVINYANTNTIETLRGLEALLPVKADDLLGTCIDVFHKDPSHQRKILGDPKNLPYNAVIKLGDETLDLRASAIVDGSGKYIGPMLSWTVITKQAQIADNFERGVGQVVNTVSSATEEMRASAESMTQTADNTNHQATTVAAAAEEATANVQAVSAAAEELSSSINEIAARCRSPRRSPSRRSNRPTTRISRSRAWPRRRRVSARS